MGRVYGGGRGIRERIPRSSLGQGRWTRDGGLVRGAEWTRAGKAG